LTDRTSQPDHGADREIDVALEDLGDVGGRDPDPRRELRAADAVLLHPPGELLCEFHDGRGRPELVLLGRQIEEALEGLIMRLRFKRHCSAMIRHKAMGVVYGR
jgi:hypothetical protein